MEKSSVNIRVLVQALKRHGLLLGQDAALPNVVGLVAGGPVRGSWWAHPASHEMYRATTSLEDHRDAVVAKLVSGKDTYVHRRLWPALVAVAAAREEWQLDGLSTMAQRLLGAVTKAGELRTDAIPWSGGAKKDSPGEASRALQRTLLVHAEEVHTESGAHAKQPAPVQAGRRYVITGWSTGSDGRKLFGASALFAEDGSLCGFARATWFRLEETAKAAWKSRA